MEDVKYFFDSYAIIEIIKENKNYLKYLDEEATITLFNLAEIYYSVLRYHSTEKADDVFDNYKDAVIEISDDTLKEAMKFRKQNKKRNLSYTDCIGYVYALRNNLLFLTGDKEFEGMNGVEFVK